MTANDDRDRELEEIESHLRGDMNITESDRIALIGVGLSVLVNLAGLAYMGGKFDQRMQSAEDSIGELKAAANASNARDTNQDVQVATIAAQVGSIQQGIGEIKAKLDRK